MAADVEHEYSRLSPDQQQEYLSCHEQRLEGDGQDNSGRLMAILRSNAYNLDDGRVAIYPQVALINHSCQPNVLNADNGGTRIIVAIRNIQEGEEILTTYVPLLTDTERRNQRLQPYGFRCDCAACRTGASDARRLRAGKDLEELKKALQTGTPSTRTRSAKDRLMLSAKALAEYVEEEGFADYYIITSRLAFDHAVLASNKSNARQWGKKHLEHHEVVDRNSNGSRHAQRLLESLGDIMHRGL
ncbi:SET domain-containing protein 5 [Diaporthe helianthi]|uniref:SET domain-containing protein 5 n=1 Tax=Diaporthe helianthi TaxID=158607 RepID=A0A2P5HZU3_DIAHE|nr:SET domain-containing protein 5 [Diaporthe helianthi]